METRKSARASWIWPSVLERRTLIEDEMRWHVIRGNELNIWKDKHVPNHKALRLKINESQVQKLPKKVSQLIDRRNGVWYLNEIQEVILD
ncbi:hypothetical protein PVK06_026952 [Gossypium arboreum]|uniref:Uncharacterized protein n=1 Tax=Gossypium arboreum TaxID=29729 RepID=A0ABR0NZ19_GOSAR|nr:hypothetical protein PVK06_026952 [Gossypium arboreum]